jgi:hypothetical protein
MPKETVMSENANDREGVPAAAVLTCRDDDQSAYGDRRTDNQELEFHAYADLFPLMEGEEFDALVADIKANGLREMIVLHEGRILDGRNRYRACLEAGVNPTTTEWNANWSPHSRGGPLGYVLSVNLHRRHLTTQQRAAIAAELATMRVGDNQHSKEPPSNDGPSMSTARAAEVMKVSTKSVERAKQRRREDPAAHEQAKAGKLERKKPEPRKAVAIDTGGEPAPVKPALPEYLSGKCNRRLLPHRHHLNSCRWAVHRRGNGPIELEFSNTSGPATEAEFEMKPADARELAKALLVYADWLDSARPVPEPEVEVIEAAVVDDDAKERRRAAAEARAARMAARNRVNEPDEVSELRAWAQSVGPDLAKKIPAGLGLDAFLGGNLGSYHLHSALRDAREELEARP